MCHAKNMWRNVKEYDDYLDNEKKHPTGEKLKQKKIKRKKKVKKRIIEPDYKVDFACLPSFGAFCLSFFPPRFRF